MTIQTGESSPHSHAQFHQFLSEHGVDQIDGLEIVRLVKMVANTYESVITTQMGGEQLTGPRWRLLLRLLMEEEQGRPEVNPTHLSRTQQVSKNTISSHLRALEEQGLIERTLDPGDRRQFRIRLSDRGRDLLTASMPDHMRFLNELIASLDMGEIDQLRTLLTKLHGSLIESGRVRQTRRNPAGWVGRRRPVPTRA